MYMYDMDWVISYIFFLDWKQRKEGSKSKRARRERNSFYTDIIVLRSFLLWVVGTPIMSLFLLYRSIFSFGGGYDIILCRSSADLTVIINLFFSCKLTFLAFYYYLTICILRCKFYWVYWQSA